MKTPRVCPDNRQKWSKPAARLLARAAPTLALAAEEAKPAKGVFYLDQATGRYFSSEKAVFSFRPMDEARYRGLIEVNVDEKGFKPYNGSIDFSAEGMHRIRFRIKDSGLSWQPVQDFTVYADMTPPTSQANWEGPMHTKGDLLYIGLNSKLSILAQDNLSGVGRLVWIADGKETAITKPLQFTKHGEQLASFRAVDNVGNTEEPRNLRFFVDGKPPVTQPQIAGVAYADKKDVYAGTGSSVSLIAQDEGAGLDYIEYQVNGGPILRYQIPIPITADRTEIRFRGVDAVKNEEPWKVLTVLQDTVAPVLSLKRGGIYLSYGGKVYARAGFTLDLSVSDRESGISQILASINGGEYEPVKPGRFTFDKPGEHRFRVRAIDRVGNVTDGEPYSIFVDTEPLKSRLKFNAFKEEKGGVIHTRVPGQIDFEAEDSGVGLDGIEVSYDGKVFQKLSEPINFATWTQSKRTIYYRAVDRLKNREPAQAVTVFVEGKSGDSGLFVETEKLPDVPLSELKASKENSQ